MIAASDRVVLLADSAKLPGSGVATVCGPEALDTVVTDAPLAEQTAAAFKQAGVTIVEAAQVPQG